MNNSPNSVHSEANQIRHFLDISNAKRYLKRYLPGEILISIYYKCEKFVIQQNHTFILLLTCIRATKTAKILPYIVVSDQKLFFLNVRGNYRMNTSDNGHAPDSRRNGSETTRKKYPWTRRRIVALTGIILLIVMYALTMVFALVKSPYSKGLLMGSIFCTIAVPVLLYAMTMVAGLVRGKGLPDPSPDKTQTSDNKSGQHTADATQTETSTHRKINNHTKL